MAKTNDLRIGVALSSGGAAGMAHVGVLEELEQAGIEIECVAGTSAGAMVGAAFAAQQLEAFRDYMTSVTRRHLMTWFDPVWPRVGLLGGRRAMDLLRPFVGQRIEELPRRFAAVATDLSSGGRAVLVDGDVIDAVRASVAIPGLFTPQIRGEQVLVDGALVDPLPVQAAHALGADFVIAVNVIPGFAAASGRLLPRPVRMGVLARALQRLRAYWDTAPGLAAAEVALTIFGESPASTMSAVLSRASAVIQTNIAAARWREEPADFLIEPAVDNVGMFDFDRAGQTIEVGRLAARAALPCLLADIASARANATPLTTRASRLIKTSLLSRQAA